MPGVLPVRGTPLSQQILQILTDRIRSGGYPPETQLPPENDLAAEFGVSRATVRTAISALAARGLVVRRQGVGTFASHLSRIANPLNEAIDFHEIIAGNGYRFGFDVRRVAIVPAEPRVAEALQLEPGARVLQALKVFTADDRPVIYCVNSLPEAFLDETLIREILDRPEVTEPFFEFLRKRLGRSIEYHIASIRPEVARNCSFPGMVYDPETPVLVIEEIGYNSEERPVWHAEEFFPGSAMTFELVRYRTR